MPRWLLSTPLPFSSEDSSRFTRCTSALSELAATCSNIIPALAMQPRATATELGVIGVLHLAVVIRIVRARGAAARQRAVELETFRAIHSQIPNPKFQEPNPNV